MVLHSEIEAADYRIKAFPILTIRTLIPLFDILIIYNGKAPRLAHEARMSLYPNPQTPWQPKKK